jgi:hypothetical protein
MNKKLNAKRKSSNVVRRLTVEKVEFDRALQALIASPRVSKADLSAKVLGWHPEFTEEKRPPHD